VLLVLAPAPTRAEAARQAEQSEAAIQAEQSEAALLADSHVIAAGDNLLDLARAHDLGYVEMIAANPTIDPWLPPPGATVLLPIAHLPPAGLALAPLVVNLGDMRLYWRGAEGLDSYPIGIGRDGWTLDSGLTRVAGKREQPAWVPPPSIRAEKPWLPARVPPGPDNPLGDYSLDLALGLVRIHGTNLPDGVGRRVSHGCIRLYPEDIAALFAEIRVGTAVAIVDEPVKLARLDGDLWLEIHPDQAAADALEDGREAEPAPLPGLEAMVREAAGEAGGRIDWAMVAWAARTRLGVPVRVTRPEVGTPLVLFPLGAAPLDRHHLP
jgi:L,D-transpeptidase ErfK/SrfK